MFIREKQQILIFTATAVLAAGFLLFWCIPLQRKIQSLHQKQALQEARLNKTSLRIEQIPMLKKKLKELNSKVGDFDASVPKNKALGNFLQEIAALMNKHNLQQQIVKHGNEIKAREFSCIPLIIQCKGRLDQIYSFFGSLQSLDRVVRLETVNLQNNKKFNGEIKMQTTAFIYYRDGFKQG